MISSDGCRGLNGRGSLTKGVGEGRGDEEAIQTSTGEATGADVGPGHAVGVMIPPYVDEAVGLHDVVELCAPDESGIRPHRAVMMLGVPAILVGEHGVEISREEEGPTVCREN